MTYPFTDNMKNLKEKELRRLSRRDLLMLMLEQTQRIDALERELQESDRRHLSEINALKLEAQDAERRHIAETENLKQSYEKERREKEEQANWEMRFLKMQLQNDKAIPIQSAYYPNVEIKIFGGKDPSLR